MKIYSCLCPVCHRKYSEELDVERVRLIDPYSGRIVLPCRGKHKGLEVLEAWRKWFGLAQEAEEK